MNSVFLGHIEDQWKLIEIIDINESAISFKYFGLNELHYTHHLVAKEIYPLTSNDLNLYRSLIVCKANTNNVWTKVADYAYVNMKGNYLLLKEEKTSNESIVHKKYVFTESKHQNTIDLKNLIYCDLNNLNSAHPFMIMELLRKNMKIEYIHFNKNSNHLMLFSEDKHKFEVIMKILIEHFDTIQNIKENQKTSTEFKKTLQMDKHLFSYIEPLINTFNQNEIKINIKKTKDKVKIEIRGTNEEKVESIFDDLNISQKYFTVKIPHNDIFLNDTGKYTLNEIIAKLKIPFFKVFQLDDISSSIKLIGSNKQFNRLEKFIQVYESKLSK